MARKNQLIDANQTFSHDIDRFTSGQQLVTKIVWELELGLRKFVDTAELIFENEVWREGIPEETISWLREWYPQVKDWIQEIRLLDEYQLHHPRAAERWTDFLTDVGSKPGLSRLLDSAPEIMPAEVDDDTIGYSVAWHLIQLNPLRRDILTQNYARLWRFQY